MTWGSLSQERGCFPLVVPLLDHSHDFDPEWNPKSHELCINRSIGRLQGLPLTLLAGDLTPQTNRAELKMSGGVSIISRCERVFGQGNVIPSGSALKFSAVPTTNQGRFPRLIKLL